MLTMPKLISPALLESGLLMSAVFFFCRRGCEVGTGGTKGKEWYPTHPVRAQPQHCTTPFHKSDLCERESL